MVLTVEGSNDPVLFSATNDATTANDATLVQLELIESYTDNGNQGFKKLRLYVHGTDDYHTTKE